MLVFKSMVICKHNFTFTSIFIMFTLKCTLQFSNISNNVIYIVSFPSQRMSMSTRVKNSIVLVMIKIAFNEERNIYNGLRLSFLLVLSMSVLACVN